MVPLAFAAGVSDDHSDGNDRRGVPLDEFIAEAREAIDSRAL